MCGIVGSFKPGGEHLVEVTNLLQGEINLRDKTIDEANARYERSIGRRVRSGISKIRRLVRPGE